VLDLPPLRFARKELDAKPLSAARNSLEGSPTLIENRGSEIN
jgi:hypothetical protein